MPPTPHAWLWEGDFSCPWEGLARGLPCWQGTSHTESQATASCAGPQQVWWTWRETG